MEMTIIVREKNNNNKLKRERERHAERERERERENDMILGVHDILIYRHSLDKYTIYCLSMRSKSFR